MDDQLDILYEQIKGHKISHEDALKQIQAYKAQEVQGLTPSLLLKDTYNATSEIYAYDESYLKNHMVNGEQTLPGVTYASLALNVFFQIFPDESSVHLHRLHFLKPVAVAQHQKVEVQIEPVQQNAGIDFQVLCRNDPSATWERIATGNLRKAHFENKSIDIAQVKESLAEFHDINRIYTANPAIGLGESFKTITHLYTGNAQVLARVNLRQASHEESHAYVLHPLFLNSAFLATIPFFEHSSSPAKTTLHSFKEHTKGVYLPFGIQDIYCRRVELDHCWMLVRAMSHSEEMFVFDVDLIDDNSQVVAYCSGCSLKRLRVTGQRAASQHLMSKFPSWEGQGVGSVRTSPPAYVLETSKFFRRIQDYLIQKIGPRVVDRSRLAQIGLNLMDLGVDSAQLLAIGNEIEQDIRIELPPTVFFEYPNLKELTEFFAREHSDAFRQLFSGSHAPRGNEESGRSASLSTRSVEESIPTRSVGTSRDDIAIIGMHGVFAGASDPDQFWQNLREQTDVMQEIPLDHWDYRPWYDPDPKAHNSTYCKWGSFIDNVAAFDAEFFHISRREAEWMDPQLRLLLQSVYATGDDAGCISRLRGTQTGVFVGVCFHDYKDRMAEMNLPVNPYMGTGNTHTVIPNRVSFYFDFSGPSIAVDTACSSSLVALHYACQALRQQECELAFVSGVNLLLASVHYRYFCSLGALSPTGRCHTFDEAADGYTPGECIASLLLKPLQQAIRDGDHIYALIKGSAALHGGYTPSLTAPSVAGEEHVIVRAWEDAGLDPETLSYIEAHGTGTKLGDPIEIQAVTQAFRRFTKKEGFCAIGSAKSNLGHTEGAAGIAGVLKVILQMQHKQIPAMPYFNTLNPYIRLDHSALHINRELGAWDSLKGVARRAGINSFGFAGAYAHVVLEEYIPPQTQNTKHKTQNTAIIVLSAKNAIRLREQAQRLLDAVTKGSFTENDLPDIAYTLQIGREAMEERLALIVGSLKELKEKLQEVVDGKENCERLYCGQIKSHQETFALFAADEELQQAVDTWLQRRKYERLAELWVKGLTIDWERLYDETRPRRISLPTYPFAKERYWIDDGQELQESGISKNKEELQELGISRNSPLQSSTQLMTFEEVWQEQDLGKKTPLKLKTLVCFLSTPEYQKIFIDVLHTHDPDTVVIFISQASIDKTSLYPAYDLARSDYKTYGEVFRRLREAHADVDAMLYFWPLEDPECLHDYASLVALFQGIAAAQLHPPRVVLVGQYENALDRCYLDSWIGFERSIRFVLPQTEVAVVFQEAHAQSSETIMQELIQRLCDELYTSRLQSAWYKEGQRHVCHVRPTTIQPAQNLVKLGETYLITGGCGGLGRVFAQYFATTYAANLILTGRSPLDSAKQAQIKTLKALGSQVLYLQADVCDAPCMKAELERAKARFGDIRGVIHAAGIHDRRGILEKDRQHFQTVLEPKVTGTLVLDDVLGEETLDFICYFSSSSAILGDFGSCDYAVANRFQMAYGRYRNAIGQQGQRHGKTVVINWPLWKAGGVGFEAHENTEFYLKSSGQRLLETGEGVALFERLLSQPNTQHLVLTGQPERFSATFQVLRDCDIRPARFKKTLQVNRASGRGRRTEMKGLSAEQCLIWDLKEYAGKVLKISREQLDGESNLADFGFDSISLTELASLLSDHYDIDITPAVFFGHSTLNAFTQYLLCEHQQTIQEFYQEVVLPGNAGFQPARSAVVVHTPPFSKGGPGGIFTQQHGEIPPNPLLGKGGTERLRSAGKDAGVPRGIAIIGMSGRFPQARNIDEMWQILVEGQDAVQEIPAERWPLDGFFEPDPQKAVAQGKSYSKWCGCLPGVSEFDPLFFEISPREAETMDPRQRLLLQESWNALEDAGYGPHHLRSRQVGMFVGVEDGDYQYLVRQQGHLISNHTAILASRLAYFLNLSGPVMAINTACSSGLVAVHQACASLRNQECDTALAAGVNLILTPEPYLMMCQAGMLSADGRCFAFDTHANGIVPGEAVAVIVLKELSQAQQDGDPIYAVIQGSGINYDGKTNGITAPSGVSQKELLKSVYDRFEINPAEIEYIVTHGTGTRLGDPVEINALYETFKDYTHRQRYCALTSTKANFGHTFAASGLVSLISLVGALRHETIPVSLHCEQQNEYIHWEESPFYVNPTNTPWPHNESKRRTGAVSAFGMSGTNAHIVLQSYSHEEPDVSQEQAPYFLLALSAKTREALHEKINDLLVVLQNQERQKQDLRQMSYTLLEGRHHFKHRCAVVIQDREDAVYALQHAGGEGKLPNLFQGTAPRDFTGQKALQQYAQDLLQQAQSLQHERNRYQEILSVVADLYCQGYELPWNQLYRDPVPRRIHLPAYPFVKECYWINEQLGMSNGQSTLRQAQDTAINPSTSPSTGSGYHSGHHNQQPSTKGEHGRLQEKTLQHLKILFGDVLKLNTARIDAEEPLEHYGIDSVMITQINQKLAALFDTLSKTVLYEYQTLKALTEHLITVYPQECRQWTGLETQVQALPKEPSVASFAYSPLITSNTKPKAKCRVPDMTPENQVQEPIAIIGISGRYPQADTLDEYWENLKAGQECLSEIPVERWSLEGFYHPNPERAVAQGQSYSKWGGFLAGFAEFDPLFFNIPPREALSMDPHERLFIEECWRTCEDAGYTRDQLAVGYEGRVGVFAGITKTGFALYGLDVWHQGERIYPHTSFSSVANRVSYLMNFHGPSLPVDTMCSSSLTAIHEACAHLRRDECDLALAGGVNLYLHPSSYFELCAQRMLSPDGHCRSFGQDGNGIVPGEGVGVVLLKHLPRAIADQDHIYAVIRGSSINHGGKTNGYTVPNPVAQGALIRAALDRAGIPARALSYLEAHGTGTVLGDPIEITGLTQAFRQETHDTQFCALGSVKSNIGHLEAAAGIAGLTKIILQLQHQELVPSLHVGALNPNIDFARTPFVVQQNLAAWERPVFEIDGVMQEYPRIAGISSFGAGGANAHAVIEEYVPPVLSEVEREGLRQPQITITPQHPAIIVLSARSKDCLQAQIQRLLAAIRKSHISDNSLLDIAYTLQVGREAMEERLGLIVTSFSDFEAKLQGFSDGQDSAADLFRGQVKHHNETLAVFAADEDMAHTLQVWISKGKYAQLVDLWVKGLTVDWQMLYGETKPRRISLPTYPFAQERYWVTESKGFAPNRQSSRLHPLLHQNTSDFSEQRFSSTFTGQEFFFADHIVQGQRILPGAAYLEMARAAVKQAAGSLADDQTGIRLTDVVWVRPIAAEDPPVNVHIGLFPEDNGEITYEIYSTRHVNPGSPLGYRGFDQEDMTHPVTRFARQPGCPNEEPAVHSQGRAVFSALTEVPPLNTQALQAECDRHTFSSDQCYAAFKSIGIDYGPAHRGLETVYVGTDQVLAKLSLPASISETQEQFFLHPSVMDAALQSPVGFMLSSGVPNSRASFTPVLPFALEELDILERCTSSMWALVRLSGNNRVDGRVQKVDIDVCDDSGKICVRMKGLSSRLLEKESEVREAPGLIGTLMLRPCWKEQMITRETAMPAYTQHLVLLCELHGVSQKHIETHFHGVRCLNLFPRQTNSDLTDNDLTGIEERFQIYAGRMFEEIRNIFKNTPAGMVLVQLVVPMHEEQHLFCGLSGLLKTAHLENPKLIGQLIEVESVADGAELIDILKENSLRPGDQDICYRDGKRWVARWNQIETINNQQSIIPWKEQGIYLITGGAGGLGLIFTEEIARHVKEATIILTGRSKLNEAIQTRLDALLLPEREREFPSWEGQGVGKKTLELHDTPEPTPNPSQEGNSATSSRKNLLLKEVRVEYWQVDVTQKQAVVSLIERIQKDFGNLNGIIHSAGVMRDNFILKKTQDELQEVLAPKVAGVVNLDRASKDLNLDFFVLFSSIAGAMGNVGQADYAAANAFLDAYACYRHTLIAKKQRQGHTLSINWPLWQEGGMHLDETTEQIMRQRTGMIPIQTSTGIQALYQSFASGKEQVMVLEGNLTQLRAAILAQPSPGMKKATDKEYQKHQKAKSKFSPPALLLEKAIQYLTTLLSSVIKLPAQRIDADAPLEKYGLDSIMALELTNQLEQSFGLLSKTLFFEYHTIREVSTYFLESHPDRLTELLEIGEFAIVPGQSTNASVTVTETRQAKFRERRRSRMVSLRTEFPKENSERVSDIAIIGLAGRYPQAQNLQEFWQNLRDGKDCITEIPQDRWDHSLYFDAGQHTPGKTHSKWGGFLDGVDQFDPLFFNISPRDAQLMDPKERLFLEIVWTLLERAGYTRIELQHRYQGRVGVYVGAMYQQYHGFRTDPIRESVISLSSYSSIANRVSHFFNFQGPSLAIDTACSSALIAIHTACESLRKDECQLAIAGGVNLSIHPHKYLGLSLTQMLGSHPQSRSFGAGDGYLPSEGVGAVLLKPLSQAIQEQDSILAVIKSTATNHSGHTHAFSVPNPQAQTKLIEENLRKSGLNPRTISYVESAANGSALGDPIEITALTQAFRKFTADRQFCAIGSVKSNLGHPEAASGIAQLTKVVLQFQHQQLVPSLSTERLNPNICFTDTPFYLQETLQEWKRPVIKINGVEREVPRRATISSFGAGGSNAHLIVEEYRPPQGEPRDLNPSQRLLCTPSSLPQIAIFSARSQNRLHAVVRQMLEFLELQEECQGVFVEEISFSNLVYTLQVGREALEYRLAMVVNNREELVYGLKTYLQSVAEDQEMKASIPIFTGNTEEDQVEMRSLLSGKTGEAVLRVLLAEQNLEKLALHWAKGGQIPWESLHEGEHVRRIALPTYPFARERYWIDDFQQLQGLRISKNISHPSTSLGHRQASIQSQSSIINRKSSIQDALVQFLSQELHLTPDQIVLNKNFRDYGVDSLIEMKLIRVFEESFQIKMTARDILEHRTLTSLATHIAQKIAALNRQENQQGAHIELETKSQNINEDRDEQEIEVLEKFKQGSLTLEELDRLI